MRRRRTNILILGILLLSGGSLPGCSEPGSITQPDQPETGPGSSTRSNGDIVTGEFGSGAQAYFLYEPSNPTPQSAPVIALMHGYGAINPRAYGGWIDHLVGNGNIVIFPVYQTTLIGAAGYTADAITALQDAFAQLKTEGHVDPDESRFAIVGHSLGGVLAMNIAASAVENDLPEPKALLLANPGDADTIIDSFGSIREGNYANISDETLLLIVVGADDALVGSEPAIDLFESVPQIDAQNREVVQLSSDARGEPPLEASHGAPLAFDAAFDSGDQLLGGLGFFDPQDAAADADAMDYFGYWKLLDGLVKAAFEGTDREFALGGASSQLSMGCWSDGVPVQPAKVIRP